MRRRRRQTAAEPGQDSFLDIVANLVGILIILVMIVGAQAKDAMVQATRPEPTVDQQDVDDEKDVVVQPEDGYGVRNPDAFQEVPMNLFPSDITLEPGMGLELMDDSGQLMLAFVAEVRPDSVLLDFNHPLAGATLHFNVKVAALRNATTDELEHGHVHSVGDEH